MMHWFVSLDTMHLIHKEYGTKALLIVVIEGFYLKNRIASSNKAETRFPMITNAQRQISWGANSCS